MSPGEGEAFAALQELLRANDRYLRSRASADLQRAVDLGRRAVRAVAEAGLPDEGASRMVFAGLLRRRFEERGEPADLDESIDELRRAQVDIGAARTGGSDIAEAVDLVVAAQLVTALYRRWHHAGDPADLAAARDAAAVIPRSGPVEPPELAGDLWLAAGAADLTSAQQDNDADALDAALDLLARGARLNAAHGDELGRAAVVTALVSRFERFGRRTDLSDALRSAPGATGHPPSRQPWMPQLMATVAATYLQRGTQARRFDDLDQAETTLRRALELTRRADPARPTLQLLLADTLRARLWLGQWEWALFSEALGLLKRLHATSASPVQRGVAALGVAELYALVRELAPILLGDGAPRPGPVRRLIGRIGRAGIDNQSHLVLRWAQLAAEDIDPQHPRRTRCLVLLGWACTYRAADTAEPAERARLRERAAAAYRAATEVAAAPAVELIAAGRAWGDAALQDDDFTGAQAGYTAAVELLPIVTSLAVDRADREVALGAVAGLPRAAAAAALHNDDAAAALGLLERARGVLLDQLLTGHSRFDDVARAAPDLADRLGTLLAELNAPDDPSNVVDHAQLTRRGRLVAHLRSTQAQIRQLPGLDRFGLPPLLPDLHAQARDGPIVVVNVAPQRCDAIVVTTDGLLSLPLLDLRQADVTDHAQRLFSSAGPGELPDDAVVTDVLGWLWQTVVAPIVTHPGVLPPGPPGRLPRVWWIPTGQLATLPLGAAGDRDRSALDLTVPSFVPTIRALGHSRAGAPGVLPRRVCVVAPTTDGLPGIRTERERLAARFPRHRTDLLGADATAAAVGAALPGHAVTHLAGHALSDLADPSAGHLVLADRPLTVGDLSAVRAPGAELAYLSACETAMSGEELADEAVHLATGFLGAGFGQVVATLWSVNDRTAPRTAERFYDTIAAHSNRAAALPAARALHAAVQQDRRNRPRHPATWASWVHLGR